MNETKLTHLQKEVRKLRRTHRHQRWLLSVLLAATGVTVTAQEPEQFEVVSIRPHPDPIAFTRDTVDGVSYHAVGLTLLTLIEDAYAMGRFQISGGPNWLTTVHYDVEARASGSALLTWERVRPMLRAMLADRFQLRVQLAMRELPCYDLVIAKGGPKLKENTDPGPPGGVAASTDATGVHIRAESGTMARLVRNLAVPAGRPIVDKTGLAGKYRITLDYAADTSPDDVRGNLPSLFTALQEQLGLKLESSRTAQDALAIQSAEKPSEN